MDDVYNAFAQKLSAAIAEAIADDFQIQELREQANRNGFDFKMSLEAVISFAQRVPPRKPGVALTRYDPRVNVKPRGVPETSANDKRFLRGLRIAADEATDKEVE